MSHLRNYVSALNVLKISVVLLYLITFLLINGASMKILQIFTFALGLLFATAALAADVNLQAVYDRANESFNEGKYDSAIEDYSKVIVQYPELIEAYYNRGLSYYRKGKYDEAISDFGRVISNRPEQADVLNSRGLALLRKGDYERAISDFTKVVSLNPRLIEAYYNRGIAYRGIGKYDQAIEDYNKVLSLKPSDTNAYMSRGIAYLNKAMADFKYSCEQGNKSACENLKEISGGK